MDDEETEKSNTAIEKIVPKFYNFEKIYSKKCIWLWGKTGCGKTFLAHYYIYPNLRITRTCPRMWNRKLVNGDYDKLLLDISSKMSCYTLKKVMSIITLNCSSKYDPLKILIIESFKAPDKVIKNKDILKLLLEHTYVYDFSAPFDLEAMDNFLTS